MHFFSDFQGCPGREQDVGVLGGEADDSAAWMILEDWWSLVLAHGLLTDVEDGTIG